MRAEVLMLGCGLVLGCAPSKVVLDGEDEAVTPLGTPEGTTWDEVRMPERLDDAACSGEGNATASIEAFYLAQTHPMSPDWPFFFLIADRPALAEVVLVGEGDAPEVAITASIDGETIGTLCLSGPSTLAASVDTSQHRRSDRFTVTLPDDWMQAGLSLSITAGEDIITYEADALGLGHAPELNLMLVMMDVLNYNHADVDVSAFEPPDSFVEDLAAAMPAAVTRLGHHAVRMPLPTLAIGSTAVAEGSPPVVLDRRPCGEAERPEVDDCSGTSEVDEWDINAAALRLLDTLQVANGHWASHYYFGHTGALFPGGWGGGKTFVSADYSWVTIHEMGHAASLPHWGDAFAPEEPSEDWYEYPWGGVDFDGGGRGPSWTYVQNEDLFVSPICEVEWRDEYGLERSDAMQRSTSCDELRDGTEGPWDGFSDFSSLAMFRYMSGASTPLSGWVLDPLNGEMAYNLPTQSGFPEMDWGVDDPSYHRPDPDLPAQTWERYDFWTPQERSRPVFTIYGSYHPAHPEATILYEPLHYLGDLPRLIDPTDPQTFKRLKKGMDGVYGDYFWWSKDLTLKITYRDGQVTHALYPFGSVSREWEYGHGPWRGDLLYFGINVPADEAIERIELYERPFVVRYPDWTDAGNIANPDLGITAGNFMDEAVLVAVLDL
jgi:hypothetical protein